MSSFTPTLFVYFVFWYCYFRYIVKKDAPGLTVTKMENKIGLRIVQNGDIVMGKVFVPDDDRLEGVNSFQDTNKVKLVCYLSLLLFQEGDFIISIINEIIMV